MISCGEPSGDLYAGALARELLRAEPEAVIVGFGGDRLHAAGASLIGNFSGLSVTGLLEVVRVVPRTYASYRRLVQDAAAHRPDVFVAIDFPDFNFLLARAIRKLGVPVVYYISPQLWAWRAGRMASMQKYVDRVLVIFPFEVELYRAAGVPVEFVGHPLIEMSSPGESRDAFLIRLGLQPDRPTVALLPGSRHNEVARTIPTLAAALPLIRDAVSGVQFVVACAPELPAAVFTPLSAAAAPLALVPGQTDNVLASTDVAITASGTATVQCALHERPAVVVYRLSGLTYRLAKRFVRVDHIAMPNLVAGRRILPELIQDQFTPDRVAAETVRLLQDREQHAAVRAALRDVRARLGGPGASGRAADAVLAVAHRPVGSSQS